MTSSKPHDQFSTPVEVEINKVVNLLRDEEIIASTIYTEADLDDTQDIVALTWLIRNRFVFGFVPSDYPSVGRPKKGHYANRKAVYTKATGFLRYACWQRGAFPCWQAGTEQHKLLLKLLSDISTYTLAKCSGALSRASGGYAADLAHNSSCKRMERAVEYDSRFSTCLRAAANAVYGGGEGASSEQQPACSLIGEGNRRLGTPTLYHDRHAYLPRWALRKDVFYLATLGQRIYYFQDRNEVYRVFKGGRYEEITTPKLLTEPVIPGKIDPPLWSPTELKLTGTKDHH